MSNCNDCKSKSSCSKPQSNDCNVPGRGRRVGQEEDFTGYFKKDRLHKRKGDPTSLDHECKHDTYSRTIRRSMCEKCIMGWVWAVGPEEALKESEKRGGVCGQRLKEAARKYKWENPEYNK